MKLKLSILSALAAIVAMCTWNCKDKSVDVPIRNPREYVWTVDTIFQTNNSISMECIWGSSESDVYAAGYSTLGTGRMWHYDGQSWQRVRLLNVEGGPFSNMGGLFAIIGFARNDIFAFGYKNGGSSGFLSFVIHFDGYQWTEQNAGDGEVLMSAWGSASNDVWSCGNAGTLIHYDGKKWTRMPMASNFALSRLSGNSSNEVYLAGTRRNSQDNGEDYYIIQGFDGSRWNLIDSVSVRSLSPSFGNRALTIVNNVLYTLGLGVYARREGKWQLEWDTDTPLYGMYAISPSHIFVVGNNSLIYSFDGTGWYQLSIPIDDRWLLTSVWCSERAAFIVGQGTEGKSIVLRGY